MKEEKYYILYTLNELEELFYKDEDGDFWFKNEYRNDYNEGRIVNVGGESGDYDENDNDMCFEYSIGTWKLYYPKSSLPTNLPTWAIKCTTTKKESPEYFI